jgi:hypothetical protein
MCVTLGGIVTLSNKAQKRNAPAPMVARLGGSVMFFKTTQCSNAESPMDATVGGMMTSVMLKQSQSAMTPMAVKGYPPSDGGMTSVPHGFGATLVSVASPPETV